MASYDSASVIGVFRDRSLAKQALDDLRQAGWEDEQVQLIERNSSNFLSSLKQTLGAHQTLEEPAVDSPALNHLPEDEREHYRRELEAGHTLVVVEPRNRPLDVRDILHRYGAYGVFLPMVIEEGERAIPLRREVATASKQVVVVGEVRIHKRVITENKTFTIPVTREEVTIERIPIAPSSGIPSQDQQDSMGLPLPSHLSGNTSSQPPLAPSMSQGPSGKFAGGSPSSLSDHQADQSQFAHTSSHEDLREEGVLRILVREEQVLIQKQPIVVEEILVKKQAVEETQHLVEPVKHEEAHIEKIGNAPIYEQQSANALPVERREQA